MCSGKKGKKELRTYIRGDAYINVTYWSIHWCNISVDIVVHQSLVCVIMSYLFAIMNVLVYICFCLSGCGQMGKKRRIKVILSVLREHLPIHLPIHCASWAVVPRGGVEAASWVDAPGKWEVASEMWGKCRAASGSSEGVSVPGLLIIVCPPSTRPLTLQIFHVFSINTLSKLQLSD